MTIKTALLCLLLFSLPVALADADEGADCRALKAEIKNLITKANHCRTNEECKETFFGCPFGCDPLIAKATDESPIRLLVRKYEESCGICRYKCGRRAGPILCVNGKCVWDKAP